MAATITWEQLRDLAAFRAEKGCAISVYLDLDPRDVPTAADARTKMRSLLAEAERELAARKSVMSREQRETAKNDLVELGRWFDDEFDRQGVRGLAVFAAGLDNLWRTVQLADPVADEVRVGAELYLAPLARFVGRGDGTLVGVVGRERGQVFRLRAGQLVQIADHTSETPGQHDQGGWSQANYERHIENLVGQHLRRIADELDSSVRKLRGVRVVLVGTEELRSDFEAVLSSEVLGALLGWTTAEAHAEAPQLVEAVRPLVDRWAERREIELLERWRQEAGKNGRAAAGWEETIEAASDGRIDVLLVGDGVDKPAFRCPKCGRVQAAEGSCPLDGTTMESHTRGLDLAVHQTLAHGGTIHVLRGGRDLEPVGGMAALLRF